MPDSELSLLHRRYLAQAGWTRSIRQHLLEMAGFVPGDWVLEVGSGTSAITSELSRGHLHTIGIDIDFPATRFAQQRDPTSSYAVSDGCQLPFGAETFDAVVCHFLLLWVEDPGRIVAEMLRVVRPGGWIIAFAEPDYGGRIDFPGELETTGELQIKALQEAGADPYLGRRLRALFQASGAEDVLTGVLGAEWRPDDLPQILASEWELLQRDLGNLVAPDELAAYHKIDQAAVEAGARTLFVPTFFGMGRAPA